jgi:protocatechuate 3,4-dioxygenase beta subunit
MEHDLEANLMHRRRALTLIAGAGLGVLAAACRSGGDDATPDPSPAGQSTTTGATDSGAGGDGGAAGDAIPEETAGPFPGDGSNGPNVLAEDGVVRSDIRSSFGEAGGVAEGVPLTVALTVLDSATGDPLPGAAVYAWHCDRDGLYSLYSDGVTDQNYLRGVQEAGADGAVSFTSIFPGAYPGRWPHIHFEVYPSLADATNAGTPLATSQLAFPEDACAAAYAADGYGQSQANLAETPLEDDMVFADGVGRQLATMSGGIDDGFVARLDVPV